MIEKNMEKDIAILESQNLSFASLIDFMIQSILRRILDEFLFTLRKSTFSLKLELEAGGSAYSAIKCKTSA